MRFRQIIITVCNLFLINLSILGQQLNETKGDKTDSNIDTIRIIKGNNNLYFSKSIFGISHIHFLGKNIKSVYKESFSQDGKEPGSNIILSNLHGVHETPADTSKIIQINHIVCNDTNFIQPDKSAYHTDAVIFDSYFEDAVIEVDNEKEILIVHNLITYIPPGYVKYEIIYIQKRPFIIVKSNINGILYTEWFGFHTRKQSPLHIAGQHAVHGIGLGITKAFGGTLLGMREAFRGIGLGGKHSAHGIKSGLDGTATGIGKAVYNESKMFYRPSREFDDMDDFIFDEKPINVEKTLRFIPIFSDATLQKQTYF
jgi:hypothetical protein